MNQTRIEYVTEGSLNLCLFITQQVISKLTRYGTDYFNTSDSDAKAASIFLGRCAYNQNGKITGTMPNNGQLSYTPSDEAQTIPAGYTSGGIINATDITLLDDYDICLHLSNQILHGGSEYTELEYVESTGTQWIDTLYTPNQDTSIEIKFQPLSGGNTWQDYYGSRSGSNSRNYEFQKDGDTVYVGYGNNQSSGLVSLEYGVDTIIYMNKNILSVNGVQKHTFSSVSFTCPFPLVLFGLRNNSTTPSAFSKNKLYYCRLWDNGQLIKDFIPVKDIQNIVCLYDKISGQYFYNQGTGNFIAGGEI